MNIEHQPQMWLSEEVWIGVGWSLVSVGLQSRIRCSGARRPLEILPATESRKQFPDVILKKGQILLDPGSGADIAVGEFPSTHDHSSPRLH